MVDDGRGARRRLSRRRDVTRDRGGPLARPVSPARWSPLAECRDWDTAQLVAHWLADATPSSAGGGGEDSTAARFWNAEASKLLGPLLHAAALDPERYTMASAVEWIDAG